MPEFIAGLRRRAFKDAITSDGVALQLDAELSWNYEVGARYTAINGLSFEVTGFLLDFSNQIIPVSQSSGSAGTGLINGGRSKHIGIEAGVTIDAGRLFESRYSFSLPQTRPTSRQRIMQIGLSLKEVPRSILAAIHFPTHPSLHFPTP